MDTFTHRENSPQDNSTSPDQPATVVPRYPHEGVLTPRPPVSPVVSALKKMDLYVAAESETVHRFRCPFCSSAEQSSLARYTEPSDSASFGQLVCDTPECRRTVKQLIQHLQVKPIDARHRPLLKIEQGQFHEVIYAAEYELAARGKHYQAGGLIASIAVDASTGDPSIVPTSQHALMREMSDAVVWLKEGGKDEPLKPVDPPKAHLTTLYEGQTFRYLPPLDGVARQPYFRESDGLLVDQPGYDRNSRRFGVFEAGDYVLGPPTREEAQGALAELTALLDEFHFVSEEDKYAALSAIFTAVTRPSLPLAPAFHVKAPVIGSGKTYLCELIGAFAGPKHNTKLSYPTTAEEATKAMLSVLLRGPAVVEFDDMSSDWIPHGVIMRMLTAENISDRVLGYSKTATVSTRTLFLGSGNNTGPKKDLLRRVVTIHLDARTQTPATLTYRRSPVDEVRSRRAYYVARVLTIINAWRVAGSPKAPADNIASYSGAWSTYCRYPLMWLDQPDPAHSLFEQLRQDPDADALGALLVAWYSQYGSKPVTMRRVLAECDATSELFDAIHELNFVERTVVNRTKLGWFLKKNANRIVDGMELKEGKADGRKAWFVACQPGSEPPKSTPRASYRGGFALNHSDMVDDSIPF
jgi:hypothetical protein